MSKANFTVGQLIHHRLFDYRGVVVDVDPSYQGDDEWYDRVARSRPPRDRPWYHVLVDGSDAETYVAEQNLEQDRYDAPVDHPLIDDYFESFSGTSYVSRRRVN
jgi:heat shock protein HspQ